jgi:zinc/manganese transport system ATP-binding protein
MNMSSAVTLENVTISYARHPAVHHVNGAFAAGSLTAIAGPNGAGKSTLLKAIAGVLPVGEGRVHIQGTTHDRIAYLPQATAYERDFPLSVLHLVCTGAWRQTGGFSAITPALHRQAMQVLEDVGMAHAASRGLGSLSAGQFQRVLFARLLMQDASLILLDEPFNALDAATTVHLLGVVSNWHRQGRTVICVLHDIAQIRQVFPDCLLLARECIAWGKTADVLHAGHLPHARFFLEPKIAEAPEICVQAV